MSAAAPPSSGCFPAELTLAAVPTAIEDIIIICKAAVRVNRALRALRAPAHPIEALGTLPGPLLPGALRYQGRCLLATSSSLLLIVMTLLGSRHPGEHRFCVRDGALSYYMAAPSIYDLRMVGHRAD